MSDIKDLLNESIIALDEKKQAQKTINGLAKDAEEPLNIDKQTVKFCKNVYFAKGKGWVNKNPLSLDKDAKIKDKTSQLMIKLRDLILNLRRIGHLDWLKEYFDALCEDGIHITIDNEDQYDVTSPAEIEEVIKSMCAYQLVVDENSETIKEEHGQRSEDIDFAPKKNYPEVLGLYSKIQNGKDVDDEYQDKITYLEMFESALNLVYDDRAHISEESK